MGKAGLIGRKISATLSSTGTPSHFLHPAEAFHGDLGTIRPDDVVLALSYSGETEELSRILAPLRSRSIPIISIVSSAASALGRASTFVLEIGSIEEADSLRLAPSSSAAAMLAVGDALALATSRRRKFRAEDFAKFHPGGSLGRRLSRVDDLMRPLSQCRVASDALSIREIFVSCRKPGRRVGAILLTDAEGRLTGVFTDADLAKLFETRDADFFDRPIRDAMTRFPSVVRSGALMSEALATLSSRKISELPVLDERGVPLGVLDVTDLVDFFPTPFESAN
jgi:arabinose-5-phosphate isomerase